MAQTSITITAIAKLPLEMTKKQRKAVPLATIPVQLSQQINNLTSGNKLRETTCVVLYLDSSISKGQTDHCLTSSGASRPRT